MSPSIENTPSVTTRISRYSPPPGRPVSRASRRISRKAATSACGKIWRGAFDSRMPSMIEAWFSASDTIRSVSPVTTGMTPVFAVKPDWNVRTAGVSLKTASSASSASWIDIVPAMVRTAPLPDPNSRTALAAASQTRGWWVSPR